MNEEQKKLQPGEKLNLEKLSEIFSRISNEVRNSTGTNDKARGEDGEFDDFLEKRRPFVEADNERVSH